MSRAREVATRVRPWLPWAVVATAAGFAALAGSYLAVGRQSAFVGSPVEDVVVAFTPDVVVAFAITELQDLGAMLALVLALLAAAAVLGATAVPAVLALRDDRRAAAVVLGAALPGLVTFGATVSTASATGAGAGAGLVVLLGVIATWGEDPTASVVESESRRAVLGAIGGAIGVGGLSFLARGTGTGGSRDYVGIPDDASEEVRSLLTRAREQSFDVAGLEPLVSTDFYEVDINHVANPLIEPADWQLSVTGAVGSEVTLDMADVRELPFEQRFVTLRCVGDRLNGKKMDNALWGGVPMTAVLEMAEPEGQYVMLRAEDDYYNEFPIEALWPGLLAYRMNGRPLPQAHGAPVRALVPGHWGEINVKWLTEIEVLEEPELGYWEKRGWHGTGPVKTVAKLWQVNHLGAGEIEVAGHAYAGTRGIRSVEVSTDGGGTWVEAELSEPLPGDDVWRQWRHRYEATEPHTVIVRATDGTGAVQLPINQDPQPNGATGWVSQTVQPR